MADVDKKVISDALLLATQSQRLAAKAAPVISIAGVLQEAVNLNQQLSAKLIELLEIIKNDRPAKSPEPDVGKVSGEARSPAD